MNIQDLLSEGGGMVLILMTVVQIAPIKINPWTWLAKAIGRAVNADMSRELSDIGKRLEEHITMDDRRTADANRARVLHFNNELLRGLPHTKEEFLEVIAEIDAYETYCGKHPEYPNNRAVLAIKNIKDNYSRRLEKHDFLDENGGNHHEN